MGGAVMVKWVALNVNKHFSPTPLLFLPICTVTYEEKVQDRVPDSDTVLDRVRERAPS